MENSEREFELLIVGGGPAGIAAALWCSELGIRSAIIERNRELGGQLLNVFNPITNYPGTQAQNGTELRDLFVQNLQGRKCELIFNCEVVGFDPERLAISGANGVTYTGNAMLLATGVRRRQLGVPGELDHLGKGILHSGVKEAAIVHGKTVLIVGGGDSAAENALILSRKAASVTIVHRGKALTARREFVEQIEYSRNIEILFESEVQVFEGADRLSSAVIKNKLTGSERKLDIDNALVRIGFQPNSELFQATIECDKRGYILVDRNNQTNLPNVFAAGDLCRPSSQTISTAVGDGISASIFISNSKI